jgi:3-deoxy-manno-octulosonate cytidylyltransferase (CMP-KDO synthetase)
VAIPSTATVAGVIPARYGSSRLPGKVLAVIGDRTLLRHVHDRASRSALLERVIVATDDDRVLREVLAFGGTAVMTSGAHRSGTDRVAEAVRSLEGQPELVVNIQADEPFLDPRVIDEVVRALRSEPGAIWTAVSPLTDRGLLLRPDVVKAARAEDGRVLYFSRAPIPYVREDGVASIHWHHIGIYGYARPVLERIVGLPPSALERAESLEQLRWLSAGIPIRSVAVPPAWGGVDTPADLERARAHWAAGVPHGEDG